MFLSRLYKAKSHLHQAVEEMSTTAHPDVVAAVEDVRQALLKLMRVIKVEEDGRARWQEVGDLFGG